jgi:hypothetical protein
MFFLERFMKTLKDFVGENAWPKGNMSEGWLIQEGIVFFSLLPHPLSIQHSLSTMDVREDGLTVVPQGMGHSVNLGRELHGKMNNFCILNREVTRPWVDRYHVARVYIERELVAHIHYEDGRHVPLPSHIIEFPQTITTEWFHVEIDRLDQFEHRAAIT